MVSCSETLEISKFIMVSSEGGRGTGTWEPWLHQLWRSQEGWLWHWAGKLTFWVLNPCTALWNFTEIVRVQCIIILNIQFFIRAFPSIRKGYLSSITMCYPSLNYNHWSIVSVRICHHLEKLPVANSHKNKSLPALLFLCLVIWAECQKGNNTKKLSMIKTHG